jgi:hypothetical protein
MKTLNINSDVQRNLFIQTLVFLLLVLLVTVPVMAHSQVLLQFSDDSANESSPDKSSMRETNQLYPQEGLAYTQTIDFSLLVGRNLPMYARYSEDGGVSYLPGVTLEFQRSVGGVDWCPIQNVVTGENGYAWLNNYTESCPGFVYYRAVAPDGTTSTPGLVEWLQTNPPTTCVPIPKCVQKSFSITCIENYDNICGGPGHTNCSINGSLQECNTFANELRKAGYRSNFIDFDDSVTPNDFSIDPSYTGHKLTDSAFHYHSGHGTDAFNLNSSLFSVTIINLKNFNYPTINPPFFYDGGINALDVRKKWGGENKWVLLDSCWILRDKLWGDALTTSHGILGYSGQSYVSSRFPDFFLDNAINQKMTMVDAFQNTTSMLFENTSAVAIVKSQEIYKKDQFPGVGYTAPDEDPNADPIYIEWPCNARGN